MKVVETSTIIYHPSGNTKVLNTHLFIDSYKLAEQKKNVKDSGFKYNRQAKRYEKYLKSLDVTLTHSFDTLVK